MIPLILAAVINLADVESAQKKLNDYCAVLKCPGRVLVSVWPKERMQDAWAITSPIEGAKGCSIRLRAEALTRNDWLAHEACHCADSKATEDQVSACEGKLLEKPWP